MRRPVAVLRLIDVNANRALEGARVCEEVARFVLQSASSCRRLRSLRHDIAQAVGSLPISTTSLLRARATRRDPGRRAPSGSVGSLERLLLVNFQRTKEALRMLEECARLAAPSHAARFQALRFQAYDRERECLLRVAALPRP